MVDSRSILEPRGFTLIEMLVVLAIAGLLAGLAFPVIERSQRRTQFEQASATLSLGVRAARADALRIGDRVVLRVIEDGRVLSVGSTLSQRLPQDVRLIAEPQTIVFFADGSATGGVLTLVAPGKSLRLSIDPATGRTTSRHQ